MLRNLDIPNMSQTTLDARDRDNRAGSSLRCLFFALLIVGPGESTAQGRRPSEDVSPPLAAFVTLGRATLSLGSNDTDGPTAFGEITGVAADGNGNIYVLDRTNHSLRSFSGNGRFLGSTGKPGRGPGDLSWPQSLFHDGYKTLYVVDRNNGVIAYETKDGTLTHRGSVASKSLPTNACALGSELFIPAWSNQKVLHVFDRNGQQLRSFGDGFSRDTSEAVRAVANRMQLQISCDSALSRIFVSPIAMGEVRAYERTGQMIWQRRLDEFDGHRIMLTPQGVTTVYGKDYVSSLLRLGTDLLLLQVRHREPVKSSTMNPRGGRGYWQDSAIVSYVLSARTGEILSRSTGTPLIGAMTPRFLVAYENDPIPRVMLLPWSLARR